MAHGAAIVRNYRPSDFDQIKAIHEASEIDYAMPSIDSRLFVVKKVLEVDGVVRQAVGFRLEVETYLWNDKSDWALPDEKFLGLKALQAEAMHDLMTKGIDTAVCWVPENIDKFFAKRMTQLGWTPDREGWRSWSRKTRTEQ
jgi:FAD/FMN-containing dehydrogenase